MSEIAIKLSYPGGRTNQSNSLSSNLSPALRNPATGTRIAGANDRPREAVSGNGALAYQSNYG